MDSESIRARLRRLRKAFGLTQKELALKAKVAQGTIGNLESGVRGYGESVVDIATALKVTPDYLRCTTDDATPPKEPPEAPALTADEGSATAITARQALEMLRGRLAGLAESDRVQAVAMIKLFVDKPENLEAAVEALDRRTAPALLGEESPSGHKESRYG